MSSLVYTAVDSPRGKGGSPLYKQLPLGSRPEAAVNCVGLAVARPGLSWENQGFCFKWHSFLQIVPHAKPAMLRIERQSVIGTNQRREGSNLTQPPAIVTAVNLTGFVHLGVPSFFARWI